MLDERYVLVGGGVIDRVRMPRGHDLVHTLIVLYRGQKRNQNDISTGKLFFKLLVNAVEGEFTLLN